MNYELFDCWLSRYVERNALSDKVGRGLDIYTPPIQLHENEEAEDIAGYGRSRPSLCWIRRLSAAVQRRACVSIHFTVERRHLPEVISERTLVAESAQEAWSNRSADARRRRIPPGNLNRRRRISEFTSSGGPL